MSLKIEQWAIDKITPYELNAKKHTEEQVEQIAASIQRFGFDQPIVIDKNGVIIKGHGRWMAAGKLGMKFVPVFCQRDLTTAEANAARLVDNKVSSTEYFEDLVRQSLDQIVGLDLGLKGDLLKTGFTLKELEFTTDEVFSLDESAFAMDVTSAVENKTTENERIAESISAEEISIAKAFGIKRITVAQSREIQKLMTRAVNTTGKPGLEGLLVYVETLEDAA